MLKTFFQPLIARYLAALKTAGYPVIVLLMTMESSFLPLPSRSHHPARRASRGHGTDSAGLRGHRHRGRARLMARRDDYVLDVADCRASAGFALSGKLVFVSAGKNWRRPSAGWSITARRACSSRGCCRARGNSSAFPPASRADGLPEISPSSRCSARRSGARCFATSASRRVRTRNSCTANCITSRSGSAAQ